VFVDHGLLRLNEGDMVMDMFEGKLHAKVIRVDASDLFLGKLAGVSEPEPSARSSAASSSRCSRPRPPSSRRGGHKGATFLAQGTIYPDVIESGGAKSKKAVTIKSHHNVGGLPEQLGLKLLEPLRDCSRTKCANWAWPWACRPRWSTATLPGPGLGVRILGEVKRNTPTCCAAPTPSSSKNCATSATKPRQDLVRPDQPGLHRVPAGQERGRDGRRPHLRLRGGPARRADQRLHDRRLGRAALRLLKKVSSRIINEVRGINRVTYDVSSKPPATIEWE
jgi:GMP synthase (glutamine-hydrolysing)